MANPTTMFLDYVKGYGIAANEVIEDIAAVAYGARRAGAMRTHPIEGTDSRYVMPEEVESKYKGLKGRLAADFMGAGLDVKGIVKPTALGNLATFLCVFRGDGRIIDDINRLYRTGWEALHAGRVDERLFEAAALEAELLEIPECCAGAFDREYRERMAKLAGFGWERVLEVGRAISRESGAASAEEWMDEIRKTGGMTERRARKQLSDVMGADAEDDPYALEFTDFKRRPKNEFEPYFAFQIYPCRPDCGKAGAIGKKIEKAAEELGKSVSYGYAKSVRPGHAFGIWSGSHPGNILVAIMSDLMTTLQISDMASLLRPAGALPTAAETAPMLSAFGLSCNAPYRRGQKTGRNEPCPCGSGKKFKRCCEGH